MPESVVEAAADLLAQPTDPSGDALEFFRIAGQFLSGLLQFGDIRDFLINLARGDSPAALLSLIGLIPGGELLRGIGYIDESINLALRTEDAVGILSRGNIAGELVTEIVDQTLRHVDDPSVVAEDDVRCPVGNRSAFTQAFPGGTTINGTVAGIPLTNTYISSAATSAFLACLGTTPAELADFTISGRYGDAVAEYAAAQRGWTVRSTPSYPSDNGVDAVYALPGGRLIVTENKGTTGTGTLGGTNLGATPSNPLPPELSMDWLFGPIDPDTEERSPAANSAVNRSVPRRIDASLAETLYLLANTDQAFEREIVIARARYVAFPVRPTIVTRTQLNGTDGGPRLRQITVYQVLSSEQ